ncbi:MAG: asparaginase [Candidatus Bathyarchaeia archaeon]
MREKVLTLITLLVFVFIFQVAVASQLPKVGVVTTGGTIAMKYDPVKKGFVPAVTGEDLMAMAPKIKELARIELIDLARIPSSYMDPPMWIKVSKAVNKLLEDKEVAGAVITHGTDTLEETAWFLDLTVKSPKPVICIGAMRGASEPDFDGARNLENAVRIAISKEAIGKGTLLVLNNQINAAREVTKTHTAQVETFKSGEFGFLGYVHADGRIIFNRQPTRRLYFDLPEALPRVDIISFYTGADGSYIKYAVDSGAKGIVIVGVGLGHVNPPVHDAIEAAIKAGVSVVMSTRVHTGRVQPIYSFKGGGVPLKEMGVILADDLNPQKARILLMLALTKTKDPKEIQKYFDQ